MEKSTEAVILPVLPYLLLTIMPGIVRVQMVNLLGVASRIGFQTMWKNLTLATGAIGLPNLIVGSVHIFLIR